MRNTKALCLGAVIALLGSAAFAADDGPVKIGILNDQSGPYVAIDGPSSVDAARMAVEDFGGTVLGRKIEVVSADHQNKPDIGATIARKWLDVDGVTAILDVAVSSVALAVQELARDRGKIVIYSGAGTSDLTGKACSPTSVHWTYDTYALTAGTSRAIVKRGGDTWFFISSDNAFGQALTRDSSTAIKAENGKVLGQVLHPANSSDFASYILQAQTSGAKVIALANAGEDTKNAVKAGKEFGVTDKQQMVGLLMLLPDVHGLGLAAAQGLLVTESFYWDLNDETRAWSKRFFERNKVMPHMVPARCLWQRHALPQGDQGIGDDGFRDRDEEDEGAADQRLHDQERTYSRRRPRDARFLCIPGQRPEGVQGAVGLLREDCDDPGRGGRPAALRKRVSDDQETIRAARNQDAARRMVMTSSADCIGRRFALTKALFKPVSATRGSRRSSTSSCDSRVGRPSEWMKCRTTSAAGFPA